MTQQKLKESARETASKASAGLKSAARDAAEATKEVASDAAASIADRAREEIGEYADARKDTLADEGQRLASGLLESVEKGVSNISEGLRNRSVGSLVTDVESFARRHPGAFVAGAAVAGFALARFARAAAPSDVPSKQPPNGPTS